jgi:hypothetical protein
MFARQVWIHGRRVYWDDFIAELSTQRFLEQCERDGKLTTGERMDMVVGMTMGKGKTTAGHSKPEYLICYADFIRTISEDMEWPEEDVRRCLTLRLEEENLLSQHVEFYLNYPAWSVEDLAETFGMTVQSVVLGIRRVHKVWPALRLDGKKRCGVPDVGSMRHFTMENSEGREFSLLDVSEPIVICGGFSKEPYDANDPTNE